VLAELQIAARSASSAQLVLHPSEVLRIRAELCASWSLVGQSRRPQSRQRVRRPTEVAVPRTSIWTGCSRDSPWRRHRLQFLRRRAYCACVPVRLGTRSSSETQGCAWHWGHRAHRPGLGRIQMRPSSRVGKNRRRPARVGTLRRRTHRVCPSAHHQGPGEDPPWLPPPVWSAAALLAAPLFAEGEQ